MIDCHKLDNSFKILSNNVRLFEQWEGLALWCMASIENRLWKVGTVKKIIKK